MFIFSGFRKTNIIISVFNVCPTILNFFGSQFAARAFTTLIHCAFFNVNWEEKSKLLWCLLYDFLHGLPTCSQCLSLKFLACEEKLGVIIELARVRDS